MAKLAGWKREDDHAQLEAVRTIQELGFIGLESRNSERRVRDLEEQIANERQSLELLRRHVAQESNSRNAVMQQVLCLETELDAKESALAAAQKALERRDAELQQVREVTVARLRPTASSASRDDPAQALQLSQLGNRVREQDAQLEQKDQHIALLLEELKRHAAVTSKAAINRHADAASSSSQATIRPLPAARVFPKGY